MTDKKKSYEREAERLGKLPRAERFEELIQFPTKHLFKVIGRSEGLSEAVQATLKSLGYEDVVLIERYSAHGRHVSLTFHLQVSTGSHLDVIYTALEQIEGVSYLL